MQKMKVRLKTICKKKISNEGIANIIEYENKNYWWFEMLKKDARSNPYCEFQLAQHVINNCPSRLAIGVLTKKYGFIKYRTVEEILRNRNNISRKFEINDENLSHTAW
jgi:hypothetical protein